MKNWEARLSKLLDYYLSGLYTRHEVDGLIIEMLIDSPERQTIWSVLPDWARADIWAFLKGCDETTVLYNNISQTKGVIDLNLIALKKWLAEEYGYE